MARSTRHSRNRKPGVTIDGTATDASKKAAAGAATDGASSGTPATDGKPASAGAASSGGSGSSTGTPTNSTASSGTAATSSGSTSSDTSGKDAGSKTASVASTPSSPAGSSSSKGGSGSSSASAPGPSATSGAGASNTSGGSTGAGGSSSGGSGTGGARAGDNDNRGGSSLVAGLIGGVAALLLAWLLSALGMFGGADAGDEIAALRAEVETLRAAERLDADAVRAIVAESAPAADPAAIESQVATIVDQRIADAAANSEGQETIDATVITSLDERLARLEANEGALADAGGVTPEIEARLAQIESGLGADDGAAQETIDALQARLDELSGQQVSQDETVAQLLAQLEQSGAVSGDAVAQLEQLTGDFGNLSTGIEGVRGDVGTLAETVNEQVAQLGALRDQIETVSGAVEGVDANLNAAVEELRGELQSVRGTASNANGAIQSVRGTVQDVSSRLGTLTSTVETATARLDDVAGRVDDLSGRVDGIDQTVSGNSEQISSLAATVEEAQTDRTVARALAANTLKNTIDRGLPFAPELEAYAAVAENPDGLDPLREFAGRGVPTVPQLVDRFEETAAAVKRVDLGVDEQAGLLDRLAASARSQVNVREADILTGQSTDAVLNRMENALAANDLQRVVSEAELLGAEEQEVAEPFLADVRARIAADRLIDDALSSALRQAG